MKRMYSEEQLIKLIEEHAGEGTVYSVNGKTGTVVLSASDIEATNAQTVQENLERIDLELEGCIDDIADLNSNKLDATKNAVQTVGGLVIPSTSPVSTELVGVGIDNAQKRITLGAGLTLSEDVLSVTGGTKLYRHAISFNNGVAVEVWSFIGTKSTVCTNFSDLMSAIKDSQLIFVYGRQLIGASYAVNVKVASASGNELLIERVLANGSPSSSWIQTSGAGFSSFYDTVTEL